MVRKMRRCTMVIYFREVESKRVIKINQERTLHIRIISLATQEYLTSTFLRRFRDLLAQSAVLKLTYLVRRVSQKRAGVQAGNMQKHEA